MQHPLALALSLGWISAAAAGPTIRSHGTLDSCVVTWGNFCPVESFGLSLLGTIALVVGLLVVGLPFRMWGKKQIDLGLLMHDPARVKRGAFAVRWSSYLGLACFVGIVLTVFD